MTSVRSEAVRVVREQLADLEGSWTPEGWASRIVDALMAAKILPAVADEPMSRVTTVEAERLRMRVQRLESRLDAVEGRVGSHKDAIEGIWQRFERLGNLFKAAS